MELVDLHPAHDVQDQPSEHADDPQELREARSARGPLGVHEQVVVEVGLALIQVARRNGGQLMHVGHLASNRGEGHVVVEEVLFKGDRKANPPALAIPSVDVHVELLVQESHEDAHRVLGIPVVRLARELRVAVSIRRLLVHVVRVVVVVVPHELAPLRVVEDEDARILAVAVIVIGVKHQAYALEALLQPEERPAKRVGLRFEHGIVG
mmetsp:Transcript_12236/g.23541  ORF Transcript_12236/g.23541 Transcript_12236/m.23541 type:complete len:209 (-) Transcript_12236:107-733(-)